MGTLHLPPSIQNIIGMGIIKEIYPVRPSTKWITIIVAIFFLGSALVVGILGVNSLIGRVLGKSQAYGLTSIGILLGISGVIGIIGLASVWSAYSNWHKTVVVYENGLVFLDRKGVKTIRWEEVDTMTSQVTKHYTNGIYTGTTHLYIIVKKDQERIGLDDRIKDVEKAAGMIRQKVFPLLYKRYSEAYNTGQPVVFGPVMISRAGGYQVGKKQFLWEEIDSITLQQGTIKVSRRNGGLFSGSNTLASTIPNVEILLAIIDQVVGIKSK